MPVIEHLNRPNILFRNGHVQTLIPYFTRRKPKIKLIKQTLATPDNDEISFYHNSFGNKKLVILTHGLEGKADDKYILHLSKILHDLKYDSLTWNMRTCGGVMNKTSKFYNAVDSSDLELLIKKFESSYDEIMLIGISLGGSLTGNLVSRKASEISSKITRACLISTPLDLESSKKSLETNVSKILYQQNFLISMKKKVAYKVANFNIPVDLEAVKKAKIISQIDDLVVAPLYGYKDGDDYRRQASCLPHLHKVKIPLLIINALDDPFLGNESYPVDLAKNHSLITLDIVKHGGHVGFIKNFKDGIYGHEKSLLEWLQKV